MIRVGGLAEGGGSGQGNANQFETSVGHRIHRCGEQNDDPQKMSMPDSQTLWLCYLMWPKRWEDYPG